MTRLLRTIAGLACALLALAVLAWLCIAGHYVGHGLSVAAMLRGFWFPLDLLIPVEIVLLVTASAVTDPCLRAAAARTASKWWQR